MITRKLIITLLLSLFFATIAVGADGAVFPECEQDSDCPEAFSCKLVCNSSCNSLCVPLKKINPHPQPSLPPRDSSELDSPFAANENPFAVSHADEPTTALVIGEKELEAEVNKSGDSTPQPPPKFVAATESEEGTLWSLAPGELTTGSKEQQILPPSFSPQPPAFSAPPETSPAPTTHPASTKPSSFSSSSESKELQQPPYKSSREKEGKQTSKRRKTTVVKTSPSSRSLETFSTISPTTTTTATYNWQEEEEEQKSSKTTPAKQPFKKAKGKLKIVKTNKPSKSSWTTKKTIAPASLADGCPAPPICGKNCGVVINEYGCQACRCLWTSGPCSTDLDCAGQGLFCDLGRCECKSGYEHDKEPGVCRLVARDKPTQQGIRLSSSTGGLVSGKSSKNSPLSRHLQKIGSIHQNRARRSPPFADKPMREERLQWPGF